MATSYLCATIVACTCVLGCAAAAENLPTLAALPDETSESRRRVTEHDAVRAGAILDEGLRALTPPYEDERLRLYVQSVGMRVARVSRRPHLTWKFQVLDVAEPSAYSLLGGFVYVSRGLLAYLDSEAELAAVLAHEIAHVESEHSLHALMDLDTLVSSMRSVSEIAERERDQERHADARAISLIAEAGYDPHAALAMMELVARLDASVENSEEVTLRHHPVGAARVARVMGQLDEGMDGDNGRGRYLKAIDRLVVGPEQRGGYVRGRRYVHPEMDISFELPRGFDITAEGQYLAAVDAQKTTTFVVLPIARSVGAQMLKGEVRPVRLLEGQDIGPLRAVWMMTESFNGIEAQVVKLFGEHYAIALISVQKPGAPLRGNVLEQAVQTARRTTPEDRRRAPAQRLRVKRAGRDLSIEQFARQGCGDAKTVERISELNSLQPEQIIRRGTLVKCAPPEAGGLSFAADGL